jgi:putative endonuclease
MMESKSDPKKFGQQGEEMATRFLEKKGYGIRQRNYRKQGGEIDIVAFDPKRGEVVFVEVKSRRNRRFGAPEEAVDRRKIEKMASTAQHWLAENGLEKAEWRLDMVCVEKDGKNGPSLRHLENIS